VTEVVAKALALWGLAGHPTILVAERENLVYRIDCTPPRALRLHRRGLRTKAELASELDWMAALQSRGLSVPQPFPALDGALCHEVDGQIVDMLGWLDGAPMGKGGRLNPVLDGHSAYRALGQAMADLHLKSDDWTPPPHFQRHSWDFDGLVGETPLWGRFWESPCLTLAEADLLTRSRLKAREMLSDLQAPDYGLIHADLVKENVLFGVSGPQLIDFDDGGFGYRLFDMATVLNFILREPDPAPLQHAFIEGYLGRRHIDLTALPLFQAIRAFTYVGWIATRTSEPGADARQTRFISLATRMAETLLSGGTP
jgi:Ser/Thr protein kinase RdoA (MazF antagonist)